MRIEWDSDWDYYDRFQNKPRPIDDIPEGAYGGF